MLAFLAAKICFHIIQRSPTWKAKKYNENSPTVVLAATYYLLTEILPFFTMF